MKYGFSTLRVPKEATERDTVENTMKWNLKKKVFGQPTRTQRT